MYTEFKTLNDFLSAVMTQRHCDLLFFSYKTFEISIGIYLENVFPSRLHGLRTLRTALTEQSFFAYAAIYN